MNYKKLNKVYNTSFIADVKSGGWDPRTGKRMSWQESFDYDGPTRQYKDMHAYHKENPILNVDYFWVHQDGTPLTEEVSQLKLK